MNSVQRVILVIAGVFLLFLALLAVGNDFVDRSWLALVEFLAAVVCFVVAARSQA